MASLRALLGSLCLACLVAEGLVAGAVKFTNVKCQCIDASQCSFEYCYIKAVNRSHQYVSAKAVMVPGTNDNVTIESTIFKRASGYRLFLYNTTVDACRQIRNPNSNKVAKFFIDIFRPYSNINHSCPYDHDFIIAGLPVQHVNEMFSKVLPFPLGDYRIDTLWYTYGSLRWIWNLYFSLT